MPEHTAFYMLDGPLAPAPAFRQTRATHLEGFADLLLGGGLNPVALLEKHDIDPQVLRNPDGYIGCLPFLEVVENCSQALGAPLFGLDLARRQPHLLGFVGSLCRAAPDLATALQCLCEYVPVMHSPECRVTLKIGRSISELECGSWLEHPGVSQILHGSVLTLLNLCKELAGGFRPLYVLLESRLKPSDIDRLEQEYGCKVQAGQSHNAIGFMTEVLGCHVHSADRVSFRLLRDYADSVRADQRNSLLVRVHDYIRGSLSETCTLARCAAALGTSVRKLQTQLTTCGVSFSELLARRREEMARSYLSANVLALDEIAHRLGYADQTSFGRAFRRWTGQSPGTYKATSDL